MTFILIALAVVGCLDAVRVPTAWTNFNENAQRTRTVDSNYNRWQHNNPKRHSNPQVPYFPAADGREYGLRGKVHKAQQAPPKYRISKYVKPDQDSFPIPTKPIYPGEGLWAKPGLTHRPYVAPTTTTTPHPETKDEKREGYEIFQKGQQLFNKNSEKYNSLPNNHQKQHDDYDVDEEDDDDEDEEDEFIPTRTYSQVRKYENEKRLPASVLEPRLKEIVTNSKIHTVYTEEGYEDGAYDHAGHEKEAEESEGYEEPEPESSEISTRIRLNPKKSQMVKFAQLGEMKERSHIDTETASSIRKDIERHFKRPKRSIENVKYPYYKANDLPRDSPLRYAQDLKSNPVKVEGKMSFYEQRTGVECKEIENKVDPVPENGQKGDLKLPRLPSLDEKIDCFKRKYFGSNPLDSPIFDEETVGDLNPVFKELVEDKPISKVVESRQGKAADVSFDADYEYDYEEVEESVKPAADGEPQAQALKLMRRRRRRRRPQSYKYRYVPNRRLMRPKYDKTPVFSEVHYKNEIKPNEQLDVFADIINNIRNSSFGSMGINPRPTTARSANLRRKNEEIYSGYVKKRQRVDDSNTDQPSKYTRRYKKNPKDSAASQSVDTPVFYEEVVESSTTAPERKVSGYTTIDIPLNKYLVPGMKPPLESEKPYVYSDYKLLQTNLVRRSGSYANHRVRRSPGRLSYSQIRRPQVQTTEKEEAAGRGEDDDDDDYVPHRPTSFHYDPETDQIVYDKKKTTTELPDVEYEEIVEEEVTEKPKPTTTHRTVYHKDVLDKANGLTLVDFLSQLKTNPAYVYIPDPEPTEKTTTTSTTTPKPGSTTPPEFLKFLEKLHSSDGYVKIEDEDEKKKKKTVATTEAPIDEEDEDEEEAPPRIVQNAPGGQFNSGGQLEIFDISEYLPKTNSYTPRITIDYSKYKTIERPHSRHNLSSRYSEDEDDLPLSSKEEEEDSTTASTTTKMTTTTTTTTTTTQAPVTARLRGRKRASRRPTTTTLEPPRTQEVTESNYTPATHRPAMRVYPRRQRPKIRLRTTTPSIDEEDASSEVHRTQRRLQDIATKIPPNHKSIYTPIVAKEQTLSSNMTAMLKRPRLITPDILNYNRTAQPREINPRKLEVETFKEFDTTKRHGGNYIPENGPTKINLFRESDETDKKENAGDYQFDDEVKIFFKGKDGKMKTIIKDPSKRLYFYAPVK